LTGLSIRDGPFYFCGGREVGQIWEKKFSTAFAEETKIMHSGTKQRNILQASEIKFIQSF